MLQDRPEPQAEDRLVIDYEYGRRIGRHWGVTYTSSRNSVKAKEAPNGTSFCEVIYGPVEPDAALYLRDVTSFEQSFDIVAKKSTSLG